MATVHSEENALRQLQSEHSELLDVIDGLRTLGLGRLVELPQLIVCGDQSSGKSSVLEAISRVRFPAKGGVCTRFATEVILRRNLSPRIKVSIEPGQSRTDEDERKRLSEFAPKEFSTGADLPELIERAKAWMGISSTDGPNAGFSDDVLKVEISGPDKPELTLVDLPGLYRAKTRDQGAEGIAVVRNLAERYMSNTRSIILAVVSAKSEYNLQEVLDLAEQFDPKRERTLGIITKPDTLETNSDEEEMYVQFANNERIKLQLGWHALRNRDYETRGISDDARDERERAFFSTGRWTNVSREFVGVDNLRHRLSRVLLKHIKRNLPNLTKEIQEKISDRQSKLAKLGEGRSTLQQQRGYLLSISSSFEKVTGQALNGMYSDSFFGGLGSASSARDPRKLRAAVRDLNEDFATNMYVNGCRRRIIDSRLDVQTGTQCSSGKTAILNQTSIDSNRESITRADLEMEISEGARNNRGIELPGHANQLLVGNLFRDQSTPWEELAYDHLMSVWDTARQFVQLLLQYLMDEHTYPLLLRTVLDPALEKMRDSLLGKLKELVAYYKKGHPLPFGEKFLTSVQNFRRKRQMALLEKELSEKHPDSTVFTKNVVRDISLEIHLLQDQFAAADIIDLMEAYYDIAITTFIDNVAILAIENCLLGPLEIIFTSLTVNNMDDQEIKHLAAELPYIQGNRQQFRSDLDKLKAGLSACNRYNTQIQQGPSLQSSGPGKSNGLGKQQTATQNEKPEIPPIKVEEAVDRNVQTGTTLQRRFKEPRLNGGLRSKTSTTSRPASPSARSAPISPSVSPGPLFSYSASSGLFGNNTAGVGSTVDNMAANTTSSADGKLSSPPTAVSSADFRLPSTSNDSTSASRNSASGQFVGMPMFGSTPSATKSPLNSADNSRKQTSLFDKSATSSSPAGGSFGTTPFPNTGGLFDVRLTDKAASESARPNPFGSSIVQSSTPNPSSRVPLQEVLDRL